MTDKKRKTFTLSPENHAYLKQKNNASAVVDDLVTQLREGGDKATAVLDMQIQQKEKELTEAEQKVERLESGLRELKQLKAEMQQIETAELEDAREALEGVPDDPTNPAVQNWAEKIGVRPEELLEQTRSTAQ